ncbi:SDR family NAD(P)-dependent oxidoreductase [Stenotrophomonas pennii]|uniref:SDR family NAD(P)-dependent oxidoreductase n=1 Tax=Stenotrophomonas lacuserhaii TaxID=2760084 RepID=UPI0032085B1D
MTYTPLDFNGQVGLITGAAGGLGLAYTRLLARLGAMVVMQDVGADRDGEGCDPDRVASAAARLRLDGLDVTSCGLAIDTRAQCHALVSEVLGQHGRLGFIIHNAGWVHYQPIESVTEVQLEHMLDIAAKAPLWLAQAAWPWMRAAGGGRIVLTTSDRALYPQYVQHGLASYAMAKSAAVGLMNVLAAEGEADNIIVNAVSPVAKTRMWGVHGEPDELHPDAVAPGVAWLASSRCVQGGWVLRASNGQFHATRAQEPAGVAYPRDLQGVAVASVEAFDAAWHEIALPAIEPRSRPRDC